jgi:hypothetical protein
MTFTAGGLARGRPPYWKGSRPNKAGRRTVKLAETYCFSYLWRVDSNVDLIASQALGPSSLPTPNSTNSGPIK